MKSIKILSILIFLSVFSYGQIAFYDANKIKSEITISKTLGGKISFEVDTNSMSSFCQIFKNYTPDSLLLKANSDSALFIEIKSWLKNNPFITIGGTQKSFSFSNNNSQNKVFSLSSVYSSIGNLNVTNFADGFAKFIVKRTKQELSITFFEQFKKDLETNEQIKILFPATYKALKAIDQEIYNYTAYLDLLRESFQKDLALLIPNISKLIDSPCMNDVFSKCPGIRIMLSDAIYFANEFSKGQHPGELIHNFVNEKADEDSLKKINPYFYPSLQTLDLFSQSLRSKQTDQYWINQDSLKLLLSDKTTFQIYIGLIYQEALNNKINFNDSLLKGILKSIKDKIDTIKPFIAGIVSKGKNIDYYYNEIRKKQNAGKDQPTYQDYYSLYDASLNFSEYLAQVPAVLNLPTLNDDKKLNSYFSAFRSLGNIYVDVYEKQYTSAIVEFSSIYQDLINENYQSQIKSSSDEKERMLNVGSLILKYGGLASTIVKAETSDDVESAIDAVALPAGSSRIKRETHFNVALNAYCGLFAGRDKINIKSSSQDYSYGVTAPIGISASWGIKHNSLSVFVSIVDLGAITAFRFVNDTAKTISKIQLKDIISPGLFISWGIPKCPISVNAGYQITPSLEAIDAKGNTLQSSLSRLSIGVCVDIPVLNFYTKPKN